MSGLDLQQELIGRGSSLPIIMITGFGDVQMAVRAMRAGAVDFIEKPFSHQLLLDRIREALKQDAESRRSRAEREKWQRRLGRLSKRQRQVLDMIVEGQTTSEIARHLGLSTKTIYAHRAEALDRIDANTVAEAAQHVFAAQTSEHPRIMLGPLF
jgi:FixJ family two-component response regulator